MSTSAGPRPASGHGIPSSSRAGRTFAQRSTCCAAPEHRGPRSQTVVGHRRVADRSHQHRVVGLAVSPLSPPPAITRPCSCQRPKSSIPSSRPFEREAQRVDRRAGPPPPTSGPTPSPGRRATWCVTPPRPSKAGTSLEVVERVLDRDDVGVLRLDVEQVRLVRRLRPVADALARHERRPAVWSRSIAVARMQPLVVAPQSTTESTPCETRIAARFVPKNADAPFFSTTVSSSRGSRRGSISTQRPRPAARRAPAPSAATGRRPSGSRRSRSS